MSANQSPGRSPAPAAADSEALLKTYADAVRAMRGGEFAVAISTTAHADAAGSLGRELTQLAGWLERRFTEIGKLQRVAEEIVSGVFVDDVLERVYLAFHGLIPYNRIGCALLTNDSLTVTAYWAKTDRDDMKIRRGYSAPLAGSSLETILETGEPRILNDLEAHLEAHPHSTSTQLIVEEGIRSSLTCPLIAKGKPIGFLFFSSAEKNTYRNLHQSIFLRIAGQLSVLIEKSRLYQQIFDLNQRLVEAQRTLTEQAIRDSLTGALNRGAILESLEEELQRADRNQQPLAVIMADVDHFKNINDTHGHLAGDAMLGAVARAIGEKLRGYDRLGRYGGEEFLIVLGGSDLEAASRTAERVREAVAQASVAHKGKALRVSLSLGVAHLGPGRRASADDLLALADAALYQAKREGRNRVCLKIAGEPDAR